MLFSVIIPTYNRNDLVCRCIDRLLPGVQQFDVNDYEIIVADDNVSEELQGILSSQYPFVRTIKGPHRGPAANRNAGARAAGGRWLIFIDDDCIPSNFLLSAYEREINNGSAKVLEGCTVVDRKKQRFDEEAPYNWSGGNLWSCNFAIEKQFFFELEGFDENFLQPCLEDVDLRFRIEKLARIVFVPMAVVVHEWRLRPAFRNLVPQIKAHHYFYKKHELHHITDIGWRIITFFRETVMLTGELVKYSFRGFRVYIEKIILYLTLIFC